MFTWLKELFALRTDEQRAKEHFAVAEGSHVARCSIVGLMMAIEAKEIAKQRALLTRDSKTTFMIAYECCLMWAIKRGMETVLKPKAVQAALLAIQRHLAKHGWYEPGTFEKIWAKMEEVMPIAMSRAPEAPAPYPLAEMLMAANLAGYPLDLMMGSDIEFGIYVLFMIQQLSDAAQLAAKEQLQGK